MTLLASLMAQHSVHIAAALRKGRALQGVVESRSLSDTQGTRYTMVLFSRRSRLHPGMRYIARGLNSLASPGNEIECEQVCPHDCMTEIWVRLSYTHLGVGLHAQDMEQCICLKFQWWPQRCASTAGNSCARRTRCVCACSCCTSLSPLAETWIGAHMCGGEALCLSGGAWRSSLAVLGRPPLLSAMTSPTEGPEGDSHWNC